MLFADAIGGDSSLTLGLVLTVGGLIIGAAIARARSTTTTTHVTGDNAAKIKKLRTDVDAVDERVETLELAAKLEAARADEREKLRAEQGDAGITRTRMENPTRPT